MEYKYGNLLSPAKHVVITQIVDCNGKMGENAISAFSPRSYQKYLKTCSDSNAVSLLGSCQITKMADSKMAVANLFTTMRKDSVLNGRIIKSALIDSLRVLNGLHSRYTVRVPYGFAGGFHGLEWDLVEVILERTLTKHRVEVWRDCR